jgi:ubiquinone biosynthesis protein UbiJ
MLHALQQLVAPAVMERLTLALNHVIGSEQAAVERLKPHAGRSLRVQLDHWPGLLPDPPPLAFTVTPAGLLEWRGNDAPADADLQVRIDAANPALLFARALAGEAPALQIQGDAALATDVNWLVDHLRWDIAADLEPLIGPAAAHEVVRMGSALARGLRRAAAAFPPRTPGAPRAPGAP